MDIASVLDSLSEEDVNRLKETAAQFFGSGTQKDERENDTAPSFPALDPAMLSGVARMTSMLNERDARSDFLMALKPLLSEERRKKADDAAMLLKMLKIVSALESGK